MAKQTFYEGQTATNPATGERIVFQAGKWAPLGSGGGVPPPVKQNPEDAKALQDLRDQATKSLNTATQAERFLDINKSNPTGGMAGMPLIGGMVRDYRGSHDPAWGQMESITSAVAPGLRPPGSGSSSDKDVKFYTRGFTNTEVPYKTNVETGKRLTAQSTLDAAHASFMDSWYQRHGTLLGGEQAFSQYWTKKGGTDPSAGTQVQLPGGGVATVRAR